MNPAPKTRKVIKVNAIAFAEMVNCLIPGDMPCAEIAEATGLHYLTVLHYTRAMHARGAVHIAAYEPDSRGRYVTRVYKLGPGRDAKRPKLTDAERRRRYLARQRQAKALGLLAA